MQQKKLFISYMESDSHSELAKEEYNLLAEAEKSVNSAYAPYSHFKVGSALLLSDGTVISGNNQENMAFPSGLCAERVALFAAAANHPQTSIAAVAVTAKSEDFPVEEPVMPCGSCRQSLIEYEHHQGSPIRLILGCETGKVIIMERVADLLPLSFNGEKLKK
jgi:cytidine deaminase